MPLLTKENCGSENWKDKDTWGGGAGYGEREVVERSE